MFECIRKHRILSLSLACLLIVACSAATIISVIDQALQIAVEAASVTGVIPPAFADYVSAGLGCLDFASAELASTDDHATQVSKITAQCSALVSPTLPPGTAQNLVNLATKLAAAIQKILTQLHVAKVSKDSKPINFTPDQKAKLLAMSTKAKQTRAAFLTRTAKK